jgi:coenzyme Q-binding protein COQ10
MAQFKASRFVAVHPNAAYAVAADVAAYKDFLPMLTRSSVRGQRTKVGAGEAYMAELVVGYEKLGINESFVSKVVTDPITRTVTATSSEGSLKSLSASWVIRQVSGGSQVDITIDYAFHSRMMQTVFAGLLEMAAGRIMQAFETRAEAMAKTIAL